MIDTQRLAEILTEYKKNFVTATGWEDEKYKWEAIKTFHDNWDIDAEDFAEMLKMALSKTGNLLASSYYFPMGMILKYANASPDEVRAMFVSLYDEGRDIVERITEFKQQTSVLHNKYLEFGKNSYQDDTSISTSLWLRYPDKYYIYKLTELKNVAKELKLDYQFKQGTSHSEENFRHFYPFYDEICEYIETDTELLNLFKEHLTETCYQDPQFRTLTIDVGYYIGKHYTKTKEESEEEWHDYDVPKLTVDQWVQMINDPTVFYKQNLEMMKRMKDFGRGATCTELSDKYGESKNFYNSGGSYLGKRIAEKIDSNYKGEKGWYQIPFVGKIAQKDNEGSYIWKLRDELSEALDKVDLSDVKLYADGYPKGNDTEEKVVENEENNVTEQEAVDERKYWWLNASPKIWRFSDVPVGEQQFYTLYNDNGHQRHIFKNFLDVKPGDVVIGYESNPVKQVVAICEIIAGQDGQNIWFKKTEDLLSPIDYSTLKEIPELAEMEVFKNKNGSLFKLTQDEYDTIIDLIREENPLPEEEDHLEKYTKENFLNEVYMDDKRYDRLVAVLKNKKNIILQGAPGVGKTFAAKRLAYSIMGEKDESRVQFVQFHQNYSYEDFMMGYRPSGEGFKLEHGIFYDFCRTASNSPDKNYFFIIDEINRGNMSKIFGELLMLIEADKRGEKIKLASSGELFSVPKNLYIIGMMNTADRSLAMIDYALRRRFSFLSMEPAFDSDGFKKEQKKLGNTRFNALIDKVKQLNEEITKDNSLGKGFCIGHSYFCGWEECTDNKIEQVIEFDILPMLEEYWFDEKSKYEKWVKEFRSILE